MMDCSFNGTMTNRVKDLADETFCGIISDHIMHLQRDVSKERTKRILAAKCDRKVLVKL